MGDPKEPGNDEGGGFLSERVGGGLERGLGILDKVDEAGVWAEQANNLSGAYKTAQAFAPFGGGLMNVVKGSPWELYKSGSELAEDGGGFLGGAAKALGPLGQGIGAIQAVGNGVQLANTISKEGFSKAYHDPEAYNQAGGAALGAAHAVLPMLGPYGELANTALDIGELGANYGGKAAGWAFGDKAKFSAESVAGGLIRGTFGDQSMGEQVRQGIGNTFGHGGVANAVGIGADVLTNTAMLPANLANTVGRGLWNEGSTIASSIANGQGAVGSALNHTGHAIADGASSAWNWAGNTAKNIGGGIANGASSAASWAGNTASSIGHAITNNPVSNTIGKIASW